MIDGYKWPKDRDLGPDSCMEVEGDEYPDVITQVIYELPGGERVASVAKGEQAGRNLVELIERDEDRSILGVTEHDFPRAVSNFPILNY